MNPQRKRALIIAAAIGGLLIVGYIFLKGRSGATTAGGAQSPGASPAGTPDTSGGTGGASGGGTSADESGLLSQLDAENQALLNSLLQSPWSQLAFLNSQPTAQTQTQTTDQPKSYIGPSGQTVTPITYSMLGVQPQPITSSEVSPPLPIPQVSGPVGSFAQTFTGGSDISSAAAVTTPTYGITYGAPAGQRATVKKGQGAISVH